MKTIIALTLTLLLGCEWPKTEYSDTLTEDAVVSDTYFVPTSHTVEVNFTSGEFDLDTVTVPQKFGVLFQCKHGKFTIEGSDPRHADLWKKMVKGHPVTITYREIYKVTKKEGKKFHDYDFLDANPIKLGEL